MHVKTRHQHTNILESQTKMVLENCTTLEKMTTKKELKEMIKGKTEDEIFEILHRKNDN